MGASSGESSAKAATAGKAAIAVPNHGAACSAVNAGKAKAAVVKNWWWESNSAKFPELEAYQIPKISVNENPDNVLTASNAIEADVRDRIAKAALANAGVFGAESMKLFDPSRLMFSLHLMKQGGIDPLTYQF